MATITLIGKTARIIGGIGNDFLVGFDALINVIYGGAGDDTIRGGSQSDVLVGEAGRDTINGGAGNDTLYGGGGDDTMSGGLGVDKLFGDGGNDRLDGNEGDDVLNGGIGLDVMSGGVGNDSYVVDNIGDVVIERAGEGVDTVTTSIDYVAGVNIENVVLAGSAALAINGNALGNVVVGNAADNRINGNDGNDDLSGAGGNDQLNGGSGLDRVSGGIGNDGIFGGGDNDRLSGNEGDDRIYGDGGNDVISGGIGSDVLSGGELSGGFSLGNDTFIWARADVINSANVRQGIDHITDFSATDRLDFSGLGLGTAAIASLVRVTDSASGTIVSANFGATAGFVDVAVLDGVHLTLARMVTDQNFIL